MCELPAQYFKFINDKGNTKHYLEERRHCSTWESIIISFILFQIQWICDTFYYNFSRYLLRGQISTNQKDKKTWDKLEANLVQNEFVFIDIRNLKHKKVLALISN